MKKREILYLSIILIGLILIVGYFALTPRKESTNLTNNLLIEFKQSGSCDEISDFWKGTGYCFAETLDGEKGVIVLHPLSTNSPGFIYTTLKIPTTANYLLIKLANLAGKFPLDSFYQHKMKCLNCDSEVRVVVMDLQPFTPTEGRFIITNAENWVYKNLTISHLKGKEVLLVIYSIAGGKENWNGEWLGIGKVEFK